MWGRPTTTGYSLRRPHHHANPIDVVVGHADELVDQAAPPEVGADGRRLVETRCSRRSAALAGQEIPLLHPVDHASLQVLRAADGPAKGEVDAGGVEVDAKAEHAGLLG